MTRKQIKHALEAIEPTTGHYQLLKDCIQTKDNIDQVDDWFRALVKSIKIYQPNTKLLALVGNIDTFFEGLLPDDLGRAFMSTTNVNEDMIYNRMIVDFAMRSKLLDYIKEYNFKVNLPVDKRMCSYCTTWNNKWIFPQRKNVIVIHVDSIDWDLYNSINKLDLWIEIFQKW